MTPSPLRIIPLLAALLVSVFTAAASEPAGLPPAGLSPAGAGPAELPPSELPPSELPPSELHPAGAVPAGAQADSLSSTPDNPANSTHATLFGIGRARQLDTYLSPLEYGGPQLVFQKEKLRPTSLFRGRLSFQSLLQLDFASTKNKPEKSTFIGGNITYDATWHYNWRLTPCLRLMAGPQIGASAGFLYNTRNGNNPAQALLSADIAASAAAIWSFRLWQHRFFLREQLDLPLLGVMFSPNYGQSYYEIFSLGQTDHNVRCTHPFNAPSVRSHLSLDIPILRTALRIGYLIDVRQSHVNNIKHHSYYHAFTIGWVKHFTFKTRRQAAEEPFIM